jgi:hypothetical protein
VLLQIVLSGLIQFSYIKLITEILLIACAFTDRPFRTDSTQTKQGQRPVT